MIRTWLGIAVGCDVVIEDEGGDNYKTTFTGCSVNGVTMEGSATVSVDGRPAVEDADLTITLEDHLWDGRNLTGTLSGTVRIDSRAGLATIHLAYAPARGRRPPRSRAGSWPAPMTAGTSRSRMPTRSRTGAASGPPATSGR
jgi:hypothetical protein